MGIEVDLAIHKLQTARNVHGSNPCCSVSMHIKLINSPHVGVVTESNYNIKRRLPISDTVSNFMRGQACIRSTQATTSITSVHGKA